MPPFCYTDHARVIFLHTSDFFIQYSDAVMIRAIQAGFGFQGLLFFLKTSHKNIGKSLVQSPNDKAVQLTSYFINASLYYTEHIWKNVEEDFHALISLSCEVCVYL